MAGDPMAIIARTYKPADTRYWDERIHVKPNACLVPGYYGWLDYAAWSRMNVQKFKWRYMQCNLFA